MGDIWLCAHFASHWSIKQADWGRLVWKSPGSFTKRHNLRWGYWLFSGQACTAWPVSTALIKLLKPLPCGFTCHHTKEILDEKKMKEVGLDIFFQVNGEPWNIETSMLLKPGVAGRRRSQLMNIRHMQAKVFQTLWEPLMVNSNFCARATSVKRLRLRSHGRSLCGKEYHSSWWCHLCHVFLYKTCPASRCNCCKNNRRCHLVPKDQRP